MASASKQLAAEMRWLLRVEELILTKRSNSRPSESWIQIARKVEGVLKKPSMSKFLAILDQHNTELIAHNRYNHERRNSFFLLGPQLFHVFHSVKARSAMLSKMPALNRPPAEVRAHLEEISSKCKDLARLLRKGPQPTVALAAHSDLSDAQSIILSSPIIRSASEIVTFERLDVLLRRAAAEFEATAQNISRAKQHQHPSKKANEATQLEVRSRAANQLARVFRKELRRPYHSHVATIVTLMSGVPTDDDYVKKVAKRSMPSSV